MEKSGNLVSQKCGHPVPLSTTMKGKLLLLLFHRKLLTLWEILSQRRNELRMQILFQQKHLLSNYCIKTKRKPTFDGVFNSNGLCRVNNLLGGDGMAS